MSKVSLGLQSAPCVVYWIALPEHTDISSEGYVGISSNLKERFRSYTKRSRKENSHLKNAINLYGWENLKKMVILVAERDYCLEVERKLRPVRQIGWNIAEGGGDPPKMIGPQPHLKGRPSHRKGAKMPPEVVERIASQKRGKKQSPEWVAARKAAMIGVPKSVPRTEEHKRKLGLTAKGKRWFTNNIIDIFCLPENKPDGFVLGRTANRKDNKCQK